MIARLIPFGLLFSGLFVFAGGTVYGLVAGDWILAARAAIYFVVWGGGVAMGYAWGARGKCELRRLALDLAAKNRELMASRKKLLLGFATAQHVEGDRPREEASLPRIFGRFQEGERP